jgi:hypothetical protein
VKRTRLKKVSTKYNKELDRFHSVVKPAWLKEHPGCQFEFNRINPEVPLGMLCEQTYGVTVHHKLRRGKYLNDTEFFMTVCPVHHDFIEANKNKSRELGYILYK